MNFLTNNPLGSQSINQTLISENQASNLEKRDRSNELTSNLDRLINNASLPNERKNQLHQASESLIRALSLLPKQNLVIFSEGATYASTNGCWPRNSSGPSGRPSTDPDENLAIKTILEITRFTQGRCLIVVPDSGNKENTLLFLRSLGCQASDIRQAHVGEVNQILVASSADEDGDYHYFSPDQESYKAVVLGPPLGKAYEFINNPFCQKVDIQGDFQADQDRNFILDEGGYPKGTSTNTRDSSSKDFFRIAMNRTEPVKTYPSSKMTSFISFSEFSGLNRNNTILTPADIQHWLGNTIEQFTTCFSGKETKLPGSMLSKRLQNSRCLTTLYGEERAGAILSCMREDPKKRILGFELLFQSILQNQLIVSGDDLVEKIRDLGVNFLDLFDDDKILDWLEDLPQRFKFVSKTINSDVEESSQRSIQSVRDMNSDQRKAALFAIFSAFKNIYDEKTIGGWKYANQFNRDPINHVNYEGAYLSGGKQMPYDALALLSACLNVPVEDPFLRDWVLLLTTV